MHPNGYPTYEQPPPPPGLHKLGEENLLSLPLDAPALETIQGQDGATQDVLARVRSISREGGGSYTDNLPAAELLVVRDSNGKIGFQAVNPYKQPLVRVNAKIRYKDQPSEIATDTGAPKVDVLYTPPKHRKDAPTLHIFSPPTHRTHRLQVTTAPEAATEHPRETIKNLTHRNEKHKSHRFRKWLAGLALVHAVNTPGGVADTIYDALSDAGAVVENTFPTYPNDHPARVQAVKDVARTMHDLDEHNYDAINARAQEFKENNKDQLMPDTSVKNFQERITSAQSHDEVVKVLDEFMHFYGKSAVTETGAKVEDGNVDAFNPHDIALKTFRRQALGVIDTYYFLPKKYVEDSKFERVAFSGTIHREGHTDPDGHYDSGAKTIRLVSSGGITDIVNDVRDDTEAITQHETGHARDELRHEESENPGPIDWAGYAARWLIERPTDVSEYARANAGKHNEPYAENATGVLSSSENMLTHPDDARRYSSEANKKLLGALIDLDREFPGISDYVIQHAGTADKSGPWPVQLGRWLVH